MKSTLSAIAFVIAAHVHTGGAQSQATAANVSQQERQVLMGFFAATDGAQWTNRVGWGTSRPVCEWYGVRCDFLDGNTNRPVVAALWLEHNNLHGALPAALSDLQYFESLNGTCPESGGKRKMA